MSTTTPVVAVSSLVPGFVPAENLHVLSILKRGFITGALFALFASPTFTAAAADPVAAFQVQSVSKSGLPTYLEGNFGQVASLPSKYLKGEQASLAATVLEMVRPALARLSLSPADLRYRETLVDPAGNRHCVFVQLRDGQVVSGSRVVIHVLAKGVVSSISAQADGRPLAYHFHYRDMSVVKRISLREFPDATVVSEPNLIYRISGRDGRLRLVYETTVSGDFGTGDKHEKVYVDADTGEVTEVRPLSQNIAPRAIYNGSTLAGLGDPACKLVRETGGAPPLGRSEGGAASGTTLVNTNYDWLGVVRSYFYNKFGRDGMDGGGGTLYSTVLFKFSNPQIGIQAAFYSPEYYCPPPNISEAEPEILYPQLAFTGPYTYSAGFPSIPAAYSPAEALDITGHEFAHGVTYFSSGLPYFGESGALNESFSDVMGVACEIDYNGGSIGSTSWYLGEATSPSGTPIRRMDQPTLDGISTDFYPERSTRNSDAQGVHINSGIGNLAFKLATSGGTHPRSKTTVSVTGLGIAKAEQIWYLANVAYLSGTNFVDFRNACVNAATALYGGTDAAEVDKAWRAVGVDGTPVRGRTIGGSVRSWVGTGAEVQILSVQLSGSGSRAMIFRAIGAGLGLSGNLANPTMDLYRNGVWVDSNDNWASHGSAGSLGGYAPANSNDSAIYRSCDAAVYSVIVSGVSSSTGLCIAEVFDVGSGTNLTITHFSGRAKVLSPGTLANASIVGGLVLSGSHPSGGAAANDVIIKAAGPSLSAYFPGNYLVDPKIDMTVAGFLGLNPQTSDDYVYSVNTGNWLNCQSEYVTTAGYAPANTKEPALHGMPVPGSYIAVVDGVGGTAGIATVEFYILN